MIDIPAGETGTTRVFSLSMGAAEARALRKSADKQQTLLGLDTLNPDGVEVFPLTDLDDLGLSGYLREGIDAQEADLQRDRAKLAALDGWVMLIHSLAFGGNAAKMTPGAALTLIGTYAQTTANTPPIDLQAEAAQPYTGVTESPKSPVQRNRASGSVVVVVLAVIAAVLLWWALS